MDKLQIDLVAVLVAMMKETGKAPSQLASAIGKPGSTINRYVEADGTPKDASTVLSTVTLAALCKETGVSVVFDRDGVSVIPKGEREFAKDRDEIGLLRGWRALSASDQNAFRRMLRGFLPDDKVDNIIAAA